MQLNTIKPGRGAKTSPKRLGRGGGSGLGKTCGKGHKGQTARAGGYHKVGFEGGQMPLRRRIPKRGFHNPTRIEYAVVNVELLNGFSAGETVTPELLIAAGLIREPQMAIKVLGDGELGAALTVHAHKFSKSAEEKITKAGGKVEILS